MTTTFTRATLGLAAVLVAAGIYVSAQDQNTNQPAPPFMAGQGGQGPGRFGGPGGRGGGPMGLLPPLPPDLNLTDAQREQIRALAQSHRDEWKALADRAQPAHDALLAAITADTVNDGLIREKSAEVAAVEADMNVARARVHAEVAQILTADQRAKLQDLRLHARRGPFGARGRH